MATEGVEIKKEPAPDDMEVDAVDEKTAAEWVCCSTFFDRYSSFCILLFTVMWKWDGPWRYCLKSSNKSPIVINAHCLQLINVVRIDRAISNSYVVKRWSKYVWYEGSICQRGVVLLDFLNKSTDPLRSL